jgi:hypothetical protein
MIDNNICEKCSKEEVCKIKDILYKFDESAKKDLGVNIRVESCENNTEPEEE